MKLTIEGAPPMSRTTDKLRVRVDSARSDLNNALFVLRMRENQYAARYKEWLEGIRNEANRIGRTAIEEGLDHEQD